MIDVMAGVSVVHQTCRCSSLAYDRSKLMNSRSEAAPELASRRRSASGQGLRGSGASLPMAVELAISSLPRGAHPATIALIDKVGSTVRCHEAVIGQVAW
jgi:hypothetical protein